MFKLSVRKVQALKSPGMYGDGQGLYLRVGEGEARSWVLRTMVHGKRRELGLGSASLVSLAEARELARTYRKVARAGGDPNTVRKRQTLTFEAAARRVLEQHLPTWRNVKHGQVWIASMEKPRLSQDRVATDPHAWNSRCAVCSNVSERWPPLVSDVALDV